VRILPDALGAVHHTDGQSPPPDGGVTRDWRERPSAGQSAAVTEPTGVAFRIVDAGSTAATWALAQYFGELDRRFIGGFNTDEALAEAASLLNPPVGLFIVAQIGDDVVGCGAILWVDDATAEIKRMWVDSQRRGIGLGKRLLAHLEGQVHASGRSRVVLDTNSSLQEAISMYRALGYFAIDRYNDNPYAHHWFAKSLLGDEADPA
jgi:ribosomal protein S18 acetylase RimI-like enzyme